MVHLLQPHYTLRREIASTCMMLQNIKLQLKKGRLVLSSNNHLRLPIGESMNEDNGLPHFEMNLLLTGYCLQILV